MPDEKMSPVRKPLLKVSKTASSILFAAFSSPKPYLNNIAALRMVANGFALSYKNVFYKNRHAIKMCFCLMKIKWNPQASNLPVRQYQEPNHE